MLIRASPPSSYLYNLWLDHGRKCRAPKCGLSPSKLTGKGSQKAFKKLVKLDGSPMILEVLFDAICPSSAGAVGVSGKSIPPLIGRLLRIAELHQVFFDLVKDKCDRDDVMNLLLKWALFPRTSNVPQAEIAKLTPPQIVSDMIKCALIDPVNSPLARLCPENVGILLLFSIVDGLCFSALRRLRSPKRNRPLLPLHLLQLCLHWSNRLPLIVVHRYSDYSN